MRLEIRYVSSFSYTEPVRESHNLLRACPTANDQQRLVDYRLTVFPSARVLSYVDYWGTRVDAFGVRASHERLEVAADSVVETAEPPQPEVGVPFERLQEPAFRGLHGEYLRKTAHTAWRAKLAGPREGDDVVAAAGAVFSAAATALTYTSGATYVGMDVNEVLDNGKGVCQDFAHLAIAMARSQGLPARYVSGYFYAADESGGALPAHAEIEVQTHAWVEVAIPGFGWWAFDPTNSQPAGSRHVKIGHGRDYDDVAPLRGVFGGPAAHSLGVSVLISREDLTAHQQQQ